METFNKRLYDVKTQNKDIRKFLAHSDAFVNAKFNPVIDKSFVESISLAVTQVNGCKLCSYAHAKNALKAGMSDEDIEFLLSGDFDNAPKEQAEALFFAEHYAESKGEPEPETEQKLLNTYGKEKTDDIMSYIFLMMIANIHGNTMEAFGLRLKGKAVEGSSFWQEIGVILNFFKIAPVMLFKIGKYKLFATKTKRLIHC